ncbi:hypothetical protein C0991_002314, partial [Blastosporella zonata]
HKDMVGGMNVEHSGRWYYVNTSSDPPQATYNHPHGYSSQLAPPSHSSIYGGDSTLKMTMMSQELYPTSVKKYVVLPPNLTSPASPAPRASMSIPPGGAYGYSTSMTPVLTPASPPYQTTYHQKPGSQYDVPLLRFGAQVMYPHLHQAPLNESGQHPAQAPIDMPNSINSTRGQPQQVGYTPAITYPGSLLTYKDPAPSLPQNTHGPLTTSVVLFKTKEALSKVKALKKYGKTSKNAGLAALKIASGVVEITTGIPAQALSNVAEGIFEFASMLAHSKQEANSLGIRLKDLKRALRGAPDANYEAIIKALLQRQLQLQQQGAPTATRSAVEYQALIVELQRIQNMVNARMAMVASQMGQLGGPGQMRSTAQVGTQWNDAKLMQIQPVQQNSQLAMMGGQQQQWFGSTELQQQQQQTFSQMQILQQQGQKPQLSGVPAPHTTEHIYSAPSSYPNTRYSMLQASTSPPVYQLQPTQY